MCGIFGLICTPWRGSARAALATLTNRGPDEQQLVEIGEATLGHTRLAIIDLAGGHQPMRTPDGRYSIVFNGEIYNFKELREELMALGYTFATASDTEVLLHGYAAWAERLSVRLDGMFAFAIWDAHERSLFAARDRIGIKPFFYSTTSGFSFASTLAPFFCLDGFPRRLDYEALRDYLAFQTPLAPHSFLADVRQLPPASWLRYAAASGQVQMQRYWTIAQPSSGPLPARDELVAEVDAALIDSVRRQLIADVPLGAFLSGGIDSSLMVHYMAQAGAQPLRTFSMRFAEKDFDETDAALAVAARYGTEHTLIDAPDIGGDTFLEFIRNLDQPLADPSYVMTTELSRATRQLVTVAISGDGGDELFAGYPRYAIQESDFPDSSGKRLLRRLIRNHALPGALLRRGLAGREMMLYRQVELGPFDPSRKGLGRYLEYGTLRACRPERTLGLWQDLIDEFRGTADTASLMRADLWTYLSENCLVKTDRASMAHSLEVRVPFLGNAVLDAVLRWPARAHFDAAGGKSLLRILAQQHLPDVVWSRPKHGFSVPLQQYFNGQWRAICEHYIARCGELAPFLNAAAVQRLWYAAKRGKSSRRLAYTFVVLLIWLEQHEFTA
jgi:asparagine synthase (glutamine-hydrolysing)